MAQIPVYNPGQRLEPSSPVSLTSGESAGELMGSATQGLGNALVGLADVLDRKAQRLKTLQDQKAAALAAESYTSTAFDLETAEKAKGVDLKDPTGQNAVNSLRKARKEARAKLAGSLSPEAQAMFEINVSQDEIKWDMKASANTVAKLEDNIKVLRQDVVNQRAGSAQKETFSGVTSGLVVRARQTKAEFMSDESVPEGMRLKHAEDAENQIYTAGIQGLLDKGRTDPTAFDKAHRVVDEDLSGLISPEQKAKFKDMIDQESGRYYRGELNKENVRVANENRNFKKNQDIATDKYIQDIALAGNDQNKLDAIAARVDFDADLSPERKTAIKNHEIYKVVADDRYEVDFMADYLLKGDFKGAINQIETDMDAGKVSPSRAKALLRGVENARQQNKNNPELMNAVRQAQVEIAIQGKAKTITDKLGVELSGDQKEAWIAARNSKFAQDILREAMSGDGTITPERIQYLKTKALDGTSGADFQDKNVNPEMQKDPQGYINKLHEELKVRGTGISDADKTRIAKELIAAKALADKKRRQEESDRAIQDLRNKQNPPLKEKGLWDKLFPSDSEE